MLEKTKNEETATAGEKDPSTNVDDKKVPVHTYQVA